MLTEKVWAKYNGVYENINAGSPIEFYDFVGGVPSITYTNKDSSTINSNGYNAYVYISTFLNTSYAVSTVVGSCGSSEYDSAGLVCDHAYTITGTCKIYNSSGAITNYLIHIRNPWGYDTDSLNWNDDDSTSWTSANKAQCGETDDDYDGDFWVDSNDYVKYFSQFMVGMFNDNYTHNVLDVQNDNGTTNTYYFNLTKNATTFVGVQYYNPRMYPYGCKNATQGTMTFYAGNGTKLYSGKAKDSNMFSYYQGNLTSGQYKLVVTTTWGSYEKKDYTVKVFGVENITITDSGNSTRKSMSFPSISSK